MRELTFRGFLKGYVRGLSLQDTNNIYKLVRETARGNLRLYEPLFLYVNATGKTGEFYNALKRTPDFALEKLPDFEITGERGDFDKLPVEYAKVYNTYLYHKNKFSGDTHTKQLMHAKIKRLQAEKRISNYRVCKELSINHGNYGAFIKNGDMNKIGLKTLRRVLEFLGNG